MHEIRQPDGRATVRITPGRAIRLYCLECQGFEATEVPDCGGDELLKDDTTAICPVLPLPLGQGAAFGKNDSAGVSLLHESQRDGYCGLSIDLMRTLAVSARTQPGEKRARGECRQNAGFDCREKSSQGRVVPVNNLAEGDKTSRGIPYLWGTQCKRLIGP